MWTIRGLSSVVLLAASIASAAPPSPYAGEQQRDIKALSSREVQDYLQGRGMGFAKAAELNNYPGPAHVLELADRLQLTEEQKAHTKRIHAAMETGAKSVGAALVEKERQLEMLFASGKIESLRLRSLLQEIGGLQAEVRNVHLQAHLQQHAVLTAKQIATYDELRGYMTGSVSPTRSGSHRHYEYYVTE